MTETNVQRHRREAAESRERERIFVAEHFRATAVYEPGQAGFVPSAGQKPVEQPKSKPGPEAAGPGSMSPDVDDGLKA